MKNPIKTISRAALILSVLLMLALCGCGAKKTDDGYPKIAYIDNVNYYGTDKICDTVPRKSPDGFIETFVPKEIMPDAYNSANFGQEQEKLEYMFLDDGQLIIHLGENWYYFEAAKAE